jgi:hypothetical protein
MSQFPYWFALFLTGGSLLTYLLGALISRYMDKGVRTSRSFNLAVPSKQNPETLFAISLAAAQTTFSTVFVVFLTDTSKLGFHLFYCPVAFAAGNWFMLWVYRQLAERGYMDGSSVSGLVPYFIYKLTNNSAISYCVLAVCIVPVIAVLGLELHYGIEFLDYLGVHALPVASEPASPGPAYSTLISFLIFTAFMVLLLGYVFVGGFRAVVASDIWQFRIMAVTLSLTFASVALSLISQRRNLIWANMAHTSGLDVLKFYLSVSIINLFQPLCFATTWQRLRAFRDTPIDFSVAVRRAIVNVAFLWTLLIGIGIGLRLISQPSAGKQDLAAVLNHMLGLSPWFKFFVFPLMTMAGFSGMFSSSDTCISALLYLTEAGRAWREPHAVGDRALRKHYDWIMALIFVMTLAIYIFTRNTRGDPTDISLALFSNVIVLAPTVLLLTRLKANAASRSRARSLHILASLMIGVATYWTMVAHGALAWAGAGGLVGSALPCLELLRKENSIKGELQNDRAAS